MSRRRKDTRPLAERVAEADRIEEMFREAGYEVETADDGPLPSGEQIVTFSIAPLRRARTESADPPQ